MELEQLLQLIDAVSESKLTDFKFEEDGVRLCLKKRNIAAHAEGDAGAGPNAAGTAYAAAVTMQSQGAAYSAASGSVEAAGAPHTAASADAPAAGAQAAALSAAALSNAAASNEAGAAALPDAELGVGGNIVKSPLVGVFYAAPAEDAEPYVSVGDTVQKGQILACVEAMKLMNEIESEYDGVVAEILVENGQGVGYGEPLFVIR